MGDRPRAENGMAFKRQRFFSRERIMRRFLVMIARRFIFSRLHYLERYTRKEKLVSENEKKSHCKFSVPSKFSRFSELLGTGKCLGGKFGSSNIPVVQKSNISIR